MGEAKTKLMQVTVDREDYEALQVRSVFMTALIEAGAPDTEVWSKAIDIIEAKAAQTD